MLLFRVPFCHAGEFGRTDRHHGSGGLFANFLHHFSLIPTAIEATSFAPVIVALTTSLVALNVTSAAWVAIEVSRSETFGLSSSKVTISGI